VARVSPIKDAAHGDTYTRVVKNSIQQRNLDVRSGLLLAPGLRDDLRTTSTHHYLWNWEHPRDPAKRQLVPA
jgi:hypothetical protein